MQDHDDDWRVELQPALNQLADQLRRRPPSDRPIPVQVGDERVEVTPAERELLVRVGGGGGPAVARALRLVCDALVVRVKLLEDKDALAAAEGEALAQARAKMRRDFDLGHRVIHAMQGEMAVLMSTGRVEHGRRLAEHRGLLGEALQRAMRVLGETGEEVAVTSAHSGSPRSGGSTRDGSPAAARQIPEWASKAMATLLLALLVVLLVHLWAGRAHELPRLDVHDFSGVPGLERVVCRPPGIILVVGGGGWSALSRELRLEAVEDAARRVEPLGYRLLQLRSPSGTTLAEWRKGSKVSLGG